MEPSSIYPFWLAQLAKFVKGTLFLFHRSVSIQSSIYGEWILDGLILWIWVGTSVPGNCDPARLLSGPCQGRERLVLRKVFYNNQPDHADFQTPQAAGISVLHMLVEEHHDPHPGLSRHM